MNLTLEDAYIMLVRAESCVWHNQSILPEIKKKSCYLLEQAIKGVGQDMDKACSGMLNWQGKSDG